MVSRERRKTSQNKPLQDCPFAEVTRRLRALATGQFTLTITKSHGSLRMKERKVDEADIRYVLKTGRVVDKHAPGGRWRYKVRGRTTENEEIDISVAVNEEQARITMITVMPTNRQGEWR